MDEVWDLQSIFAAVKKLLEKHAGGLDDRDTIIGSKATTGKSTSYLYGKKAVSIAGRKARPTYICGIILQKHFVGFCHMPIYSHSQEFTRSPELQRMKKGKSCINITHLNSALSDELDALIGRGIRLYQEEGWV